MTDTMRGGALIRRDAIISDDGMYRYRLDRRWGEGNAVGWVMLNPSTADALVDDPTIRRCMRFAQRWGYDAIVVTNLFALRATDPRELAQVNDPVGPDNNAYLMQMSAQCSMVIAAWGGSYPRQYRWRVQRVRDMLPGMMHLGLTGDCEPRHPLYLRNTVMPEEW